MSEVSSPNLMRLVRMIEVDIRQRGLTSGEPYFTAEEIGRRFGAHHRAASRAMRMLAEKQMLIRRRGVGTFVGPRLGSEAGAEEEEASVHILTTASRLQTGLRSDELLSGILDAMPDAQVQLTLLPHERPERFVKSLLEGSRGVKPAGLVLVACPREIQEAVAAGPIPAVVFGGVHPTTWRMASADVDHREVGRLAARYLVDRGRRRVGLVLRNYWLPGDNLLLDGISEVLASTAERISPVVRSLTPDHRAIVSEVGQLLDGADPPTGLICRGGAFVTAAVEAIRARGLRLGQEVDVVVHTDDRAKACELGLPSVAAKADFQAQARTVGKLLADSMVGEAHAGEHMVLPVAMVVPEQ